MPNSLIFDSRFRYFKDLSKPLTKRENHTHLIICLYKIFRKICFAIRIPLNKLVWNNWCSVIYTDEKNVWYLSNFQTKVDIEKSIKFVHILGKYRHISLENSSAYLILKMKKVKLTYTIPQSSNVATLMLISYNSFVKLIE